MYVCICQAVTESDIHQAAQNGVKTLKDLRAKLGVTMECGRCAACSMQCLRNAHEKSTNSLLLSMG
ncbi:MAG: (2Fe-2S)-binding protein [Methylotenera sp.]|uniref:(2Fe-2S)-binding protein n=1 Tax=Methylotenera sp. TaxID=2051956 RepID=UPI0024886C33|nr:(2Fe-2S)-binding protein [Methylotenera sp.]MDI1310394.1 (2Fe-2S)-binding protein [Methylotenera sp.]